MCNLSYKKQMYVIILFSILFYGIFFLTPTVISDECYTLKMISYSFDEIYRYCAIDVHPPLYYWLLKLFMMPFGHSIWMARFFSLVFYEALIVVALKALPKIISEKQAIMFCVLWILYPVASRYSVQVRMYALATFLVFTSGILAYKCYVRNKTLDWILLGICVLAAAYTHYFALINVGLICLCLLIVIINDKKYNKLKRWCFFAVCVLIGYIPWLGCFLGQLAFKTENEYWLEPLSFRRCLGFVVDFFGVQNQLYMLTLFGCIIYLLLFICLIKYGKKSQIIKGIICLIIPFGTFMIGFVVSWVLTPIMDWRYLVPCSCFLILFAAIAFDTIKPDIHMEGIKTIVVIILLVVELCGFEENVRNEFVSSMERKIPLYEIEESMDSLTYYVENGHW